MPLPQASLKTIVARALREDLGRGDITSEACVDPERPGEASLRARERLVFCGSQLLIEVYRQIDPSLEISPRCRDGRMLQPGDTAAMVLGSALSILAGERVALNFIQRMSGIATLTRAYVDELPQKSATRIVDTRKTTPGLRLLERYAVRCGGGRNHREDLSAAVLIKDNHIVACGGIRQAVQRARAAAPHTSRISCEVDTLQQLDEALDAGADVVMLDNFDDLRLRDAVKRAAGRALIEVSGGVTLERVAAIARLGVDVISVGALTHSARAVDLGLDLVV
ncbi:MAG: carboxylating nicotinate-nucleotide diphosphorylase [Deltaproteobacteria bacterium]|nr:carboxylating nicotinate-nucleotide diphosphorylase [Deltaproteobacteria bacterium]